MKYIILVWIVLLTACDRKHGRIVLSKTPLHENSIADTTMSVDNWQDFERCMTAQPKVKDREFAYIENTTYDQQFQFIAKTLRTFNNATAEKEQTVVLLPGMKRYLGETQAAELVDNNYKNCQWSIATYSYQLVGELPDKTL